MDESVFYELAGRLMRERDDGRTEIASLRANQERIRDEAFQLGRQASWDEAQETIEVLKAELATANDRIVHMSTVLVDAQELLGVEETGELILRPIERLKAELDAAKRELNAAEDAEEPTKYMLWAEIRLRDGKIRQDAEEIVRLKALVQEALESAPPITGFQARCRAALACRPQGEKS